MNGVSKNQDIGKHSRKGLGIGSRIPRGFCLRKGIGSLQITAPVRLGRCWWRVRGVGERRRELQGGQREGAVEQPAAALGYGMQAPSILFKQPVGCEGFLIDCLVTCGASPGK